MYSQVHTEFLTWAWEVMLMLKLHECDILQNCDNEEEQEGDEHQFGLY